MICQQCGKPVLIDMAAERLPPWCQNCGADIRDALYGAKAGAEAIPTAVLTNAPSFDSRPLPVRERRRQPDSPTDAQSTPTPDRRTTALFLGIALFAAAVVLAVFQFLT